MEISPRTATALFPEEIWEIILEDVKDSKDLWSCLNTCKVFRKILSPKRNLIFFDLAFPTLFQSLSENSILKSRTICKSWRDTVDHFYENQNISSHPDSDTNSPGNPSGVWFPKRRIGSYLFGFNGFLWIHHPLFRPYSGFSQEMDLRSNGFVKKMKDHPKNPFIGRSVTILEEYPDYEEYLETADPENHQVGGYRVWHPIQEFLATFGQHIWHLSFIPIQYDFNSNGQNYIFRLLKGDLQKFLPNLRSLTIQDSRRTAIDGNVDNEIENEELLDLPPLPHLERLDLGQGPMRYCMPEQEWQNFLGTYRHQIKSLKIFHGTQFLDLEWSNLLDLEIVGEQWRFIGTPMTYPNLAKMPELRKLSFEYNGNSLRTIIGSLIKICCTSTKLNTICLRSGAEEMNKWSETSRLPDFQMVAPENIKTLNILETRQHSDRHCDYGWLKRFGAIENLSIQREFIKEREYEWEDVEDVEIYKFVLRRRMYESNIWEVFKQLKSFRFGDDIYTRKGYEGCKKQRN